METAAQRRAVTETQEEEEDEYPWFFEGRGNEWYKRRQDDAAQFQASSQTVGSDKPLTPADRTFVQREKALEIRKQALAAKREALSGRERAMNHKMNWSDGKGD